MGFDETLAAPAATWISGVFAAPATPERQVICREDSSNTD